MATEQKYADAQIQQDNNPYLMLDIIQEMDNLKWRYKCDTPGKEQFTGPSEDLIEEVIELEHDRKQYFKDYDISVGSDGEILINKEYEGCRSPEAILDLEYEALDIELVVRGEMEREKIDELVVK